MFYSTHTHHANTPYPSVEIIHHLDASLWNCSFSSWHSFLFHISSFGFSTVFDVRCFRFTARFLSSSISVFCFLSFCKNSFGIMMFPWSKSYILKAAVFCIGYVQQYGYLFHWIRAKWRALEYSKWFVSFHSSSSIRLCGARHFSLLGFFFPRAISGTLVILHVFHHLSIPPIKPKNSTTKLVQRNTYFGEIFYLFFNSLYFSWYSNASHFSIHIYFLFFRLPTVPVPLLSSGHLEQIPSN